MKLHAKLVLSMLFGLILVMVISQFVQYYFITSELISDLSESSLEILKEREEAFAKNIFLSVERAFAGSLERGEMDKFEKLLIAQRQIKPKLEYF